MKFSRIDFEIYEGNVEYLPPVYQEVSCHIIFYVKMGDKFRSKSQMVAVEHKTTAPSPLTYSYVLSQHIVRIYLEISALNDLKILAWDIQN